LPNADARAYVHKFALKQSHVPLILGDRWARFDEYSRRGRASRSFCK